MNGNNCNQNRTILAEKICEYKRLHPYMKNPALAMRWGVSKAMINRIENGETKNTSLDNFVKILKGVGMNTEQIRPFLKEYFPNTSDQYERVYSHNIKNPYAAPEMEDYFQDAQTCQIMLLIVSSAGTTRLVIKEEFGNKGIETLEHLLENNIVSENDGIIKGTDKTLKLSQKTSQAILKNLVSDCYDINNFGKKDNWLSVQCDSVNKKKLMPVLLNKLRKLYKEIDNDINDPEYSGNDVIFVGMVMDDLIRGQETYGQSREALQ